MQGLSIAFLTIAVVSVRAHVIDASCAPGEIKMDDCNTCICAPDGSGHACTRMECGETLTRISNEKVCTPGNTKMEDCNNCFCIPDGSGWACTRKICLPTVLLTCEPGESFMEYCNTCHCLADGLRENAACTRVGCSEDMWNQDGTMKIAQPQPREKRSEADVENVSRPDTRSP